MPQLKDTAEHVIDRAKKNGATAADVMIREDDTFSVTVRMGEVETLKEAISRSLLLRVFVGKRTATSHTSDLPERAVDRLVDETIEMADSLPKTIAEGFLWNPYSGANFRIWICSIRSGRN